MRSLFACVSFSGAVSSPNPYKGPTSPVPGLVRVEIQVNDDPELGGVTIADVSFNGKTVALKPAGVRGYRGGVSLQVPPGEYDLIWHVSRGKKAGWPSTVEHKQKVKVGQRDVWVQITIQGEKASIA